MLKHFKIFFTLFLFIIFGIGQVNAVDPDYNYIAEGLYFPKEFFNTKSGIQENRAALEYTNNQIEQKLKWLDLYGEDGAKWEEGDFIPNGWKVTNEGYFGRTLVWEGYTDKLISEWKKGDAIPHGYSSDAGGITFNLDPRISLFSHYVVPQYINPLMKDVYCNEMNVCDKYYEPVRSKVYNVYKDFPVSDIESTDDWKKMSDNLHRISVQDWSTYLNPPYSTLSDVNSGCNNINTTGYYYYPHNTKGYTRNSQYRLFKCMEDSNNSYLHGEIPTITEWRDDNNNNQVLLMKEGEVIKYEVLDLKKGAAEACIEIVDHPTRPDLVEKTKGRCSSGANYVDFSNSSNYYYDGEDEGMILKVNYDADAHNEEGIKINIYLRNKLSGNYAIAVYETSKTPSGEIDWVRARTAPGTQGYGGYSDHAKLKMEEGSYIEYTVEGIEKEDLEVCVEVHAHPDRPHIPADSIGSCDIPSNYSDFSKSSNYFEREVEWISGHPTMEKIFRVNYKPEVYGVEGIEIKLFFRNKITKKFAAVTYESVK